MFFCFGFLHAAFTKVRMGKTRRKTNRFRGPRLGDDKQLRVLRWTARFPRSGLHGSQSIYDVRVDFLFFAQTHSLSSAKVAVACITETGNDVSLFV